MAPKTHQNIILRLLNQKYLPLVVHGDIASANLNLVSLVTARQTLRIQVAASQRLQLCEAVRNE
jgi:hypothetical protein